MNALKYIAFAASIACLVSLRETGIICGGIHCLASHVFADESVAMLHEKIIARVP